MPIIESIVGGQLTSPLPRAIAAAGADQSIDDATTTLLNQWTSVEAGPGFAINATNIQAVSSAAVGKVMVVAKIRWEPETTSTTREIQLLKRNAADDTTLDDTIVDMPSCPGGADPTITQVIGFFTLALGERVRVQVFHRNGAPTDVQDDFGNTELRVQRIP